MRLRRRGSRSKRSKGRRCSTRRTRRKKEEEGGGRGGGWGREEDEEEEEEKEEEEKEEEEDKLWSCRSVYFINQHPSHRSTNQNQNQGGADRK